MSKKSQIEIYAVFSDSQDIKYKTTTLEQMVKILQDNEKSEDTKIYKVVLDTVGQVKDYDYFYTDIVKSLKKGDNEYTSRRYEKGNTWYLNKNARVIVKTELVELDTAVKTSVKSAVLQSKYASLFRRFCRYDKTTFNDIMSIEKSNKPIKINYGSLDKSNCETFVAQQQALHNTVEQKVDNFCRIFACDISIDGWKSVKEKLLLTQEINTMAIKYQIKDKAPEDMLRDLFDNIADEGCLIDEYDISDMCKTVFEIYNKPDFSLCMYIYPDIIPPLEQAKYINQQLKDFVLFRPSGSIYPNENICYAIFTGDIKSLCEIIDKKSEIKKLLQQELNKQLRSITNEQI